MQGLTIGPLAKMAGVGVETIRFYQREGLLRVPDKIGAFKKYTNQDAQLVNFIKKAQELGFSLKEIKDILQLNQKPKSTCAAVKEKADQKIAEIDLKIKNLKKIRKSLQTLSCASAIPGYQEDNYQVQDCFGVIG